MSRSKHAHAVAEEARKLEEYRVKTPSAMALEQFESVGLTIHPGQKVGYLLRDSAISGEEGRILPAPFLQGGEVYDKKKYLEMLLKAAAEVLVTFGLDYKDLAKRYPPARMQCRSGVGIQLHWFPS